MNSVLITGATGFIGHHLCSTLIHAGDRVVALGRHEPNPEVTTHYWDMSEAPAISAMEKADTVFHLAGLAHALKESRQDEEKYFRINVEGTRKLLETAQIAGIRRFVLFSSVKAMGEGGEVCQDELSSCKPKTIYGSSKLAAEKLVLEGGYVPEPVVLRLSMVYGNSEKGNLPRMIRAVSKGRFPPLPEIGNKRSMVHVDDVVQAAVLAASMSEAVGKIYLVTDGTPYSTRQIYQWICEALEMPVPRWNISLPILKTLALAGDGIGRLRGRRFMFDSDALKKLTGSACYSSAKLERELGFRPEHHLKESIPNIVRFLAELQACPH